MERDRAKTRKVTSTNLFEFIGPGKEFNPSEFPTNRDVLQMAILLKGKRVYEQNIAKNFYSAKEIGKEVAPLVINLWKRCNAKYIPPVIVKEKTEVEKIKRLWVTAAEDAHSRYRAAEKEYLESILDKLMDLTTCRHRIYLCQEEDSGCSSLINCLAKAHIVCSCPLSNKIAVMELRWIYSQRVKVGEKSDMQMGSNDVKESKRQTKAEKRKAAEKEAEIQRLRRVTEDDLRIAQARE